jgi:hypothetical protein
MFSVTRRGNVSYVDAISQTRPESLETSLPKFLRSGASVSRDVFDPASGIDRAVSSIRCWVLPFVLGSRVDGSMGDTKWLDGKI